MSRYYRMRLEVTGFNPERETRICMEASEQWNFTDTEFCAEHVSDTFAMEGESNLCGGETEEEFADRVAKAVWRANLGFCGVKVIATYLEDPPIEEHVREQSHFEKLLQQDPEFLNKEE